MNPNTVETFEKLPDENVVVAITKDKTGKIVRTQSYTPDVVTQQLIMPTQQIARLNEISALFSA